MLTSRARAAAKWIVGLTLVPLIGGCDSTPSASPEEPSAPISSNPGEVGPSLSPPRPTPRTTPCSRLLAQGWEAPREAPDVSYRPRTGIAVVTYTTADQRLVLDFKGDRACLRVPGLSGIVRAVTGKS